MSARQGKLPFVVKKLGLAHNDLTSRSIRVLTKIADMAGKELEELDVEGNEILLEDEGMEGRIVWC